MSWLKVDGREKVSQTPFGSNSPSPASRTVRFVGRRKNLEVFGMETLGVVSDPWNGGIYAISAIKRGMVELVPIGGGKPLMVRQAILDFFYKREPYYKEGG